MSSSGRRLFALDQGFPQNILEALRASVREAELVWIGKIDPALSTVEDWELLLRLSRHDRPWDGLITTDDSMLNLPKEMVVLHQTRLTLVVTESAGHDPVTATGLLLAHLPHICKETDRTKAQVWCLRTHRKPAEDPWVYLNSWAKRNRENPNNVYQRYRLRDEELGGQGQKPG